MRRIVSVLLVGWWVVAVGLVTGTKAQFMPNGFTLGGNSTQAILDHFKSIPNPRLLTNFHNTANVNALKAKQSAGVSLLNSAWSSISNFNAQYSTASSSFYYNLMGGTTAQRDALATVVRNYSPGTGSGDVWNHYLEAADFARVLFAYDAVANTGALSAGDKSTYLAKVEQFIAVMQNQTPAPTTLGNISENVAASIGLAGIVFADHAEAYNWIDKASKYLQTAYADISNSACIAEGPSYQVGFGVVAMTGDFFVTLEEHGFKMVNQPDNNLFERMFVWMVKTMRPDRYCVETEDCWPNTRPSDIWPAKYIEDDTEYRRALQWYAVQVNGNGLHNYITWDTGLNPAGLPQWNPTQFFTVSSCAVFRKGFGTNDTWLYFLGDRTPMFFSYGGVGGWIANKNHGHWDASSITLHAHGGYLLTESARFRGLSTKYHNLIMVDGNEDEPSWGISSSDKYSTLKNPFATPFMDGADMDITYVGTDFTRTVLYVKQLLTPAENEYFIVIDDVEAVDAASHTYQLLFHNKAGNLTGSGTKMRTTQTGTALAELHFLEPDLFNLVKEDEVLGDGSYSGDYTDHRILCRYDGTSFQYVTLIYPRSTSMASPTVAEINGTAYRGGSLTINGHTDIVLSKKTASSETVGGITSDAKQLVVRTSSGSTALYLLKDGTTLTKDGKNILSTDVPVTVAALKYESNTRLTGCLKLAGATNLTFYSQDGAVSSWKFLDPGDYGNFAFDLAAGGIVQGRVTDQDLRDGVPGVKVEAIGGAENSYCYTDGNGDYKFEWVRPGNTTIRFSRTGYTTVSVTGQNVVSGQTITLNQVLSITTDNPLVLNAAVLKTTNTTAEIRVSSNKPCYNQVQYGPTAAYGSATTKTAVYTEVDTVILSGLTPGQLYHYQALVWDYAGRQGQSADLQFVPVGEFFDDFNDNNYTDKWTTASPTFWSETGGILSKTSAGNYAYTPRRLKDIIFVQDLMYSSFTLTVDARSLRSSNLRDVCVVFNYQDDTHYYYANFSMTSNDELNGIFKVDAADKVKIGTAGPACLSGTDWASLKIVRDLKNGFIGCYCGDMTTPVFIAYDSDFGLGQIGLASERSVVEFDDITILPYVEGVTGIAAGPVMDAGRTIRLQTSANPVAGGKSVDFYFNWEPDGAALPLTARVVDLQGRLVRSLVTARTMETSCRLTWDLADRYQQRVPAGVYMVILQAGPHTMARRVVIAE